MRRGAGSYVSESCIQQYPLYEHMKTTYFFQASESKFVKKLTDGVMKFTNFRLFKCKTNTNKNEQYL